MDQIKNRFNTEMTISDLKNLGKEGGATALLETGEILYLRPRYATAKRPILINGREAVGDVIVYYGAVFDKIRTVKRDNVLVARRIKIGASTKLQLTGQGYTRPGEQRKKGK
ncbi:hypothetical protein Q7V23_03610 [Streptococcus suis]|uniref:hypothetical protein n=1 Tax=Streptococcus suis TaxID=1307 RepID=UPI00298F5330|nr:hypothetical protein [Streptococcus suis]MDW8589113.1 hypothetical protein [Streptococcus suis]MDW8614861.1 hypothetical protein [Streptococcus suis]